MNQITVRGVTETQVVRVSIPGVQGPSATRGSFTAVEAIASSRFIHIDTDGAIELADATDDTKPVDGYVETAIAEDASGTVIVGHGQVLNGFTGLNPGSDYYLSETPGTITLTPPAAAGNLVQYVGKALTATTLLYVPDRGVTL